MSVAHSQVAQTIPPRLHVVEEPISLTKRIRAYVALTKPRIIELLLVTTVPPMVVAAHGWPNTGLVIATVLGGALAAGGANAINMVIDRDIDAVMHRTRARPIVRGIISPQDALFFAVFLEIAAFALLFFTANLLSAVLALAAAAFYVFVYTIWLKRSSPSNIVIGGAAGAVPVLIGWAAVTGTITYSAFVLFVLVFLWTPPHFWALAIKYRDDYAAADVPMLPVVASMKTTTLRIFLYSVAVVLTSFLFHKAAHLGLFYLIVAVSSGVAFCLFAWQLHRRPSVERAMRVFHYSITYLTVLFCAMAIDQLIVFGLKR
jgi:protoheme IX farnesyltransferase